jgi:hypothetical protein
MPENAPPGYTKVALIYLEEALPLTRYSEEDFRRKLATSQPKLCDANGKPLATMLIIVTARGTYRWSEDEFKSLDRTCSQ